MIRYNKNPAGQHSNDRTAAKAVHLYRLLLKPEEGGISMNQISPLNQDELRFKNAYQTFPEAHLDEAKTVQEINTLCPELAVENYSTPYQPADSLQEVHFPQFLDMAVMPHLRYAPAFLHSHTFFEIVCVFNGTCKNIFASQTLEMNAGEICIVAPTAVHALSAFSDDCVIYNLAVKSSTFRKTFLDALPHQGTLYAFFSRALHQPGTESYLYFKKPRDPVLQGLAEQMHQEYIRQENYYNSLLNALLTTFFIQLLRKHEKSIIAGNPAGKKQEENIIFILKYIEHHLNTITLKELSAFFNYSDRQITRILKDYTGKTFTQLLQEARLTKACELLKQPDASIHSIIETVGYSNATYFYSLFQKQYGLTPTEYRKNYLTEAEVIV